MRVIDRLYQYLTLKNIKAYAFERSCGIANGYLKKQFKGGGTIGSEILEKIIDKYTDLSLLWLITSEGEMLLPEKPPAENQELQEDEKNYQKTEVIIRLLQDKISLLENVVEDKKRIIVLLERQIQESGK